MLFVPVCVYVCGWVHSYSYINFVFWTDDRVSCLEWEVNVLCFRWGDVKYDLPVKDSAPGQWIRGVAFSDKADKLERIHVRAAYFKNPLAVASRIGHCPGKTKLEQATRTHKHTFEIFFINTLWYPHQCYRVGANTLWYPPYLPTPLVGRVYPGKPAEIPTHSGTRIYFRDPGNLIKTRFSFKTPIYCHYYIWHSAKSSWHITAWLCLRHVLKSIGLAGRFLALTRRWGRGLLQFLNFSCSRRESELRAVGGQGYGLLQFINPFSFAVGIIRISLTLKKIVWRYIQNFDRA